MQKGVITKLRLILGLTVLAGLPMCSTFFAFYKIFQGSLNTKLWLLLALLIQYTVNSHIYQGWRSFCSLIFDPKLYFKSYKVIYEDENIKKQTKNILFCYHPHGIFSLGNHFLHMFDPYFKQNSYILATRLANEMPFWGFWTRLMGCQNADPKSLDKYMSNQQVCTLVPGGFEEAAITSFKSDNLYLNDRKGFIKYALRYGYQVSPIFNFGENKMFYTYDGMHWLRILTSRTKFIPSVVFWSKYFFVWLPNDNIRMTTIIGKPIQFPKITNPTTQQVDEYHQMYIKNLKELFNRYKAEYGDKDNELILHPEISDKKQKPKAQATAKL